MAAVNTGKIKGISSLCFSSLFPFVVLSFHKRIIVIPLLWFRCNLYLKGLFCWDLHSQSGRMADGNGTIKRKSLDH